MIGWLLSQCAGARGCGTLPENLTNGRLPISPKNRLYIIGAFVQLFWGRISCLECTYEAIFLRMWNLDCLPQNHPDTANPWAQPQVHGSKISPNITQDLSNKYSSDGSELLTQQNRTENTKVTAWLTYRLTMYICEHVDQFSQSFKVQRLELDS